MLPFPFSKGGLPNWLNQSFYNNDIQKFVQEMVEKSISSSMKHNDINGNILTDQEDKEDSPGKPSNIAAFESHDHVYVRIYIQDESTLPNLKIYHNSNQLIIEGLPSEGVRQVVPLPSMVKMKETVSEYRDHYLQIKMKKRIDPQFTEVAVPLQE